MRLFVAVPLPPDIAAAAARVLPASGALRHVRAENMHVTLAFLGAVPDDRLAAAVAAVRSAGARQRSFTASVDRLGRFPEHDGVPRVVWLGIGDGADALGALASSVRDELRARELPFDAKPFEPHVTLARVRDGADRADARAVADALDHARFPATRFAVNGFALVESHLTPQGPRYAPHVAVPLEPSNERDRARDR